MESKLKPTKLVFICSRIPFALNARLDKAIERTGLKKQALIERAIRLVLARLGPVLPQPTRKKKAD